MITPTPFDAVSAAQVLFVLLLFVIAGCYSNYRAWRKMPKLPDYTGKRAKDDDEYCKRLITSLQAHARRDRYKRRLIFACVVYTVIGTMLLIVAIARVLP